MSLPEPEPSSTCLITGASSGMGREFAREFARRGHGVTVVARREERLRKLAEELEGEHGVRAEVIAADLADQRSRTALVEEVSKRGLVVDVLVSNAGFGTNGRFTDLDHERELEQVRLNCEAVVDLTRTFLPGMVERDRGGVINVASTAAFQPVPFMATYAATKALVLSFSEAVSSELSDTGVTVTAVSPGPVPTEFPSIAGSQDYFDLLPGFAMVEAEDVAAQAIRAFEKGKRSTIPGLINNIQVFITRPIPNFIKLPATRRMFGRKVDNGR